MEYLAMVIWLFAITVEVYWNWDKIEIQKENQKHWLWAIPKFVVGTGILFWLMSFGYLWYWAGLFILATHMLFFPEGLNKWRGKGWGYLGDPRWDGEHKSIYDYLLQQVIKSPAAIMMWLWFRIILALFAIGNILLQGKCTWYALNHGGCL